MVSAFQMQQYYRPTALSVDTQKFFDEEDDSVLDEGILEQSGLEQGLEMSPNMVDSRRESFAMGASLFSPRHDDWSASVEMQSVPSNNPFLDQTPNTTSNNPFMRMDQNQHQQAHGFVPQQTWTSTAASAGAVAAFDGLPVEFDSTSASLYRTPIPFSNPANNVTMFSSVPSQASLPTSPQKEHWSGNMAMNKKVRPGSPGLRSHNELRKGDGIRKKNARFDIPAERNLANIDQLIAQSTDEQETKELKQQKRLLRNRQAALDSRQRKKQHTERLEDEKKHYTSHISTLEEELEDMRLQMSHLMEERAQLVNRIQIHEFDKEELVRRHTEETADLRRKLKVLTTHIESTEGTDVSGASGLPVMPGANAGGFSGSFGPDMGISVDGSWDGMGYMPDFGAAMDPAASVPDIKQELPQHKMQVVVANKKHDAAVESEKPSTQGGLLFMLFLVGALVCSSRSSVPSIPRVSEDVRAASESILQNVIKDAGVAEPAAATGFALRGAAAPSGTINWPAPSPMASAPAATGLDGVAPSMLGDLTDLLTRPTAEQSKEEAFGMTASQYSSMMMSDEFLQAGPSSGGGERSTSQGRRNLAEAMASVRQGSKAEVYTRSLLWDQIPSDVVRTFVKMVAECNQNQGDGISA
ncbi:hypothetical protein GGTG_01969 [Gaeumannomyces tritici R3-111a-1]|uniref:BZIP domain-containing protein n=1 Tax=Gaeumannomyces tritici (strain R3-111a-1) TaxID=644352 RepID=J3NL28_GAET3|nr:hypothetical protein GGTG_01969 [Gaeumannomyces tritici R3-111a-1]EJT81995.1 hypothetical protein GGTG_01969 [Gaeumannomyces tritici R3-111a-1]